MSSMEFSLSMKGSLKPYNLIPKALRKLTTSILMNQLSKLCVFRITSIISNHNHEEKFVMVHRVKRTRMNNNLSLKIDQFGKMI